MRYCCYLLLAELPGESVSQAGRMQFDKFDINKVLSNGSCLLGSEGKEYELDDDVQGRFLNVEIIGLRWVTS